MRRLLAVLGADVSQSLSPLLHGAAALRCGLDVAYVPVNCANSSLFREAVQALCSVGALGCNVTIPYKKDALDLSDHVTARAQEIAGANTLSFEGDRIVGDNTDGPALETLFSRLGPDALRSVQVLGAGGASRAAVWALRRSGAQKVSVCTRHPQVAQDFGVLEEVAVQQLSPVEKITLLVSGLPGEDALAQQALEAWVDLKSQPIVLDLAYGSLVESSALVRRVQALGWTAFDGRSLLVEQAALSLAGWTGGDLDRIRGAMREALSGAPSGPGLL